MRQALLLCYPTLRLQILGSLRREGVHISWGQLCKSVHLASLIVLALLDLSVSLLHWELIHWWKVSQRGTARCLKMSRPLPLLTERIQEW